MKWSDLPSLNSLRAFSVVAEERSYSRAGAALNVTHAAISQQVKALEERLGIDLVIRQGRGIALTPEGERLARDLSAGFATILSGVETLTGSENQTTVQVTMSPAFAVTWMMPKITDFQQRHPEITLMLNPTAEVIDLEFGSIDLAIRYRDKRKPDTPVHSILIADMVIVGSPELIKGKETAVPSDLLTFPWLQELGTNEVADWLVRHGVRFERPLSITHMPGNLIMEAVRRGDGITFTARPWVRQEIEDGQLVELFTEKAFGNYYLQIRSGRQRPAVKAFIQWLLKRSEVAQ